MIIIKMIQVSKYRWQIESLNGKIIKDDIYLNDEAQAAEYVKAFASSFGWNWEVYAQKKTDS